MGARGTTTTPPTSTTTTSTTTTTTPTPTTGAYFVDSFDSLPGSWNPSPSPFNTNLLFKVPNGVGGNAAAMVVTPSSSGPNASSEMTALWTGNGDARIHTGLGEDTWYRVRVRFPAGKYFPTTGQWNWLVAWHDDGHTTSFNSNAYSSEIGVYTDYPVISGAVGQNPQLVLRLMGGNTMSPTSKTLFGGSLVYDHWYELLIHFVWHPSQGSVEWYGDGQLVGSTPFPTLYQNPDGTLDHLGFGLYNYRLHDPVHTSQLDFDLAAFGATRASVGG